MRAFLHSVFATLLFACLTSSTAFSQTATIATDLPDYSPGSTAIITGTGFQPGETVTLQVLHYPTCCDDATSPDHQPFTTTADANGNVNSSWLVPGDQDELGATLQLTAVGQSSGLQAEVVFTDASSVTIASVPAGTGSPQNALTICTLTSVTFTATKSGGSCTPIYQWKLNGGNVGSNQATYTSSTLTSGDVITVFQSATNNGCSANSSNAITMTVTLTAPSTPGVITGSSSVCAGATGVTYSILGVSGATSYTWSVPGGASITSGQGTTSINVTFGSISGNVSVTASNVCGTSAPQTEAVTVNPRPTGVISGTQTICPGSSATLSIVVTGTGPWSGTLSSGQAFSGSSSPISVVVNPTTNTTYTLTTGTLVDANCSSIAADRTGSATVTATDNVKPTITCPPNVNATTNTACTATGVILGTPTGTDNCTLPGSLVFTNNHASTTYPLGPTTVTWTVTDAAGNTNTCPQTVTVTDNVNPTITCPPAVNVSCASAVPVAASNRGGFMTLGGSVSDNCSAGNAITVTFVGDVITNQTCANRYTITRTYKATDAAGNFATCDQIITVNDQTAPTFTAGSLNGTFECSNASGIAAAQTLQPVATDNCGGTITYNKTSGSFVADGSCPHAGTYTNTWTATDVCGNTSTATFTQVITITDNTPPSFTSAAGSLNGTFECSNASGIAAAQTLQPVATDNCGGTITYNKTSGSFVADGSCPHAGTYTNTWTATDVCGNTSTATFTQVITITDNTPPSFTSAAGSLNGTFECSNASGIAAAQTLQPVATDNCGGTITYNKTSGSFVADGSCPHAGTYTNTWTATDVCGNTSTATFTQVITITDNTPPSFTSAAGSLNGTFECSNASGIAAAQTLQPVATDNCGGTITYNKTSGSFVADGSCPHAGTYTNTWTATDVCGNTSTATFTQVITITDNTPPSFTSAAGSLNGTFECSNASGIAAAQTLQPVATDNCGGTITYNKTSGSFVADGSCPHAGTYTNTWTATDVCGNTSTATFTQVITITDNTPPSFTSAAGSLNGTFECSNASGIAAAQTLQPVATDNCGGTITYNKTSGSFVADGSCPHAGTYTNTWTATDVCGNTSTATFTQVITITDNTPPSFTSAAGSLNGTFECSNASGIAAAQTLQPVATDNCGGTITYNKTSGSFVADGSCPHAGTYTNTWTATDVCGNTSTATFTQVITITDNTPPSFTSAAGSLNGTFECSNASGIAAAQTLQPVATDNCGGTITYNKTSGSFVADGSCPHAGTYTNTWTATDVCGNTSTATFTQVITITDNTAPTLTGTAYAGTTGTNACKANAATAAPFSAASAITGYTDNCGGAVTATLTNTVVTGTDCAWTVTYTFSVKDVCGNTLVGQTYSNTGSDQTAPTLTGTAYAGTTGTNACKANAATAAPFSATSAITGYTDNCGGAVTATLTNTSVTGTDASWTVTYTFTIKDVCGNALTGQTYANTGSDQTPPTITALSVSPTCLWPPNHKMRDIIVTPIITDNCSTPTWTITKVTSNEPVNGTGDGNTAPDWIIGIDGHSLQLRAEREGTGNGRIYTITITATDAAGNTSTKTVTVCVAHNITSPANGNAFKVGSTVNFSGTFWDIAGKKHTAQWNINGTLVSGVVVEPSGTTNGTVTGSYKFTTPGIYTLQMNVTDQNGITSYAKTNGDMEAIVVVYDPNGGYTYGSGSFVSSPGAIPSNSSVTGEVTYGFQSNYYKGATNPKGQTEFDFIAGDLQFNALNFDYLVVNGPKAQFKGSGKMTTGSGLIVQSGIGFILTAIDGQVTGGGGVDKIRMKIYNKSTGQIYYDNQPGASDASDPVTPVSIGSSIVIVNSTPLATSIVRVPIISTIQATKLEAKVIPNPTSYYFTLGLKSASNERVKLTVVDVLGRVVEQRSDVPANSTLQLGNSYHPGIYFAQMIQGKETIILKLIKEGK